MTMDGFYRRPLPEPAIAFASPAGRQIFQEALAMGGLAGYFPLAEQFHTQTEPAFCGLGTLVILLNALAIDPQRIWKGVWRWYGEEFLDCCHSLAAIQQTGITVDEFCCLAGCNGAIATPYRPAESSLNQFRATVAEICATPSGIHLVAAYSRPVLGQTGDGHFSPIAGYHPQRDLVLLLDVARFKYPPHWVPLTTLWEAFASLDPVTGQARGYITLCKRDDWQNTRLQIVVDLQAWRAIAPVFGQIIPQILAQQQPESAIAALHLICDRLLHHLPQPLEHLIGTAPQTPGIPADLQAVIQTHPLFKDVIQRDAIQDAEEQRSAATILTLLVLVCPDRLFQPLAAPIQTWFQQMRDLDSIDPVLAQEIRKLRQQVLALQTWLPSR